MIFMSNDTFFISQYGYKIVAVTLVFFVFTLFIDSAFISFIALVVAGASLFIFRNPERVATSDKKSLYSICDGVVSAIEKSEGKTTITINSRCQDVSILRSPTKALVKDVKIYRGAHLNSDSEMANKLNETLNLTLEISEGKLVQVKQIVSQNFLSIKFKNILGKTLFQSERYGLMLSGKVIISFDNSAKVIVKEREILKAGESLLATY